MWNVTRKWALTALVVLSVVSDETPCFGISNPQVRQLVPAMQPAAPAERRLARERTSLDLNETTPEAEFVSGADAWIDYRDELTHPEILSAPISGLMAADLSYSQHSVWMRFQVTIPAAADPNWVLRVKPALLNEVDLYQFNEQGKLISTPKFRLGHAGQDGSLDQPAPAFALSLPGGQSTTFVVRIKGRDLLDAAFTFSRSATMIRTTTQQQWFLALYAGIVLALIVYNAVIYRTIRESFFPYYLVFIASISLTTVTLFGYFDHIFRLPFALGNHLNVLNSITSLFGIQFCRHFLRTETLAPKCDRAMKVAALIACVTLSLSISPLMNSIAHWVAPLVDLVIVSTAALILFSTYSAVKFGFRPARFFAVSWSAFLFPCLYYYASIYLGVGAESSNFLILQTGSMLEMLLMTLAIGDRINLLQKEKIEGLRHAWEAERIRNVLKMVVHDMSTPSTSSWPRQSSPTLDTRQVGIS